MIEVRHLRQALAVLEHGSFRRAARALGIAQPSLSRSIQALEADIGARVFDRGPRRVTPTPVGRVLLERAPAIVDGARELEREVRLLTGREVGELHVGLGTYLAARVLGPTLGRLMKQHPGLTIRARVDSWQRLAAEVRAGRLEVAVIELSGIRGDPALAVRPLAPMRGVLFCRARHPILSVQRLTFRELRRYPLAAPPLTPRILTALGRQSEAGDTRPPPEIECNEVSGLKAIVAASDAIALAPVASLQRELRSGRVVALPIPKGGIQSDHGVVQRAGRTLSPAADAFISQLLAVDAKLAAREQAEETALARR